MGKEEFKYYCRSCGRQYDIIKDIMLCPSCREDDIQGKPLKGVLDVKLHDSLKATCKEFQDFDLFDYLPIEKEYFPSIPVGNTPLIKTERLNKELGFNNFYLKFDGTNPTGSFKDRASYLVSAFAKKSNLNEIVLASTGNAASSMAGIAAAAGQKAYIFAPSSAPRAKLVQCLQYGAELIAIKGNYDKAFDLSLKFSEYTGILNRNTAYNPLTIEGKKTASFEIVSQLKKNVDYIFVPTGDGVVLSGIIKGFNDLLYLGLIKKLPKVIAVQAEGSSFIYKAFYTGEFDLTYKAKTLADSISVDAARNGYSAVDDLKKIKGDVITVTDNEILQAQKYISSMTGIFSEPSSAAAAAGFIKMKNDIPTESNIVILLSGHGLKDVESASRLFDAIEPCEPDIDYIISKLKVPFAR